MSASLAALLLTLAVAGPTAPEDPGPPDRVTFTEHVAPILYARCTECHRPGEAAPFPLLTYEDARRRGSMLRDVTAARTMPPWHPDPEALPLRDERRLTEAELDTIDRWVEQGMPEGDPSALPAVPDFPGGWTLGTPDLVVTMDEAFEVPADGPDVFRCFVLKLDLPEDRWVKAIEMRPSSRDVVHHALFFLADSEAVRAMDGEDGRPGFRRMPFLSLRGALGGWVLGARPIFLPDDLAMALPGGTDLVMQTHFHPSGKVRRERATVGLYLTDEEPSRRLRGLQVPPRFGFSKIGTIEAGDPAHTVTDSKVIDKEIELIGVGGHAHYLCTSMEAVATLPDGSTLDLFRIPHWDFDWQGRYLYAEPVRLPAGTRIDVELVYDNTATNPSNPTIPPVDVRFGNQSTDEMGSITFSYVLADEDGGDITAPGGGVLLGGGVLPRLRGLLGRGASRGNGADGEDARVRAILERLDADGDGVMTREEFPEPFRAGFDRADRDRDGRLTGDELRAVERAIKNRRPRGIGNDGTSP